MDKSKLKELFKKDNFRKNTATIFGIGVLFIFLGNTLFGSNFFNNGVQNEGESFLTETVTNDSSSEYDGKGSDLEKKLVNIFSSISGAGEVKVMVTLSYSSEVILAEEIKTNEAYTTETANSGDERNIESSSAENKIILTENSDGSTSPFIVKEVEPKVCGIIIVAEGGDNIVVKSALSKAAQALLDVPANKVEVLKMK